MSSELKEKLCEELLKGGLLKPYDVIRHSYTKNRLNNGERNMNRIESQESLCHTLDTRCDCLGVLVEESEINELGRKHSIGDQVAYDKPSYRIRKLTPKECFRLMGVNDEDYDKIAQNQSDSSLYHLAGDSIVVNVLMSIFEKFF